MRLVGADSVPELQATADLLRDSTPANADHTLWIYVCGTPDAHWTSLLAAAHRAQAHTRADVARALYGEDIPPATLCLSYGKPFIASDIIPLVVADEVQRYWTQRPGFALDEHLVRQVSTTTLTRAAPGRRTSRPAMMMCSTTMPYGSSRACWA